MQSNGKFVRTSFSNPIRGRGRGAPRRRNKGLRGMEHHVSEGGGPSGSGVVVLPPARNPSFSQRKKPLYQVHSGFFHILCFFWGCKFKGEAHAVRQRLAGPAAPSSGPLTPAKPAPPGSAPPARQRPAHAAKPEHPAHLAPTSAAAGCAP